MFCTLLFEQSVTALANVHGMEYNKLLN